MSYARWSQTSNWYVYWHSDSGSTRDTQVCAVHYAGDPDGTQTWHVESAETLDEAMRRVFKDCPKIPDVEREELRGYLAEWFEDVAAKYPEVPHA